MRGDLLAYAQQAAREISRPAEWRSCVPAVRYVKAVNAARGPLRKRPAQLQAMLDRASDRGEPAPRVNDVLDCILAPIYLRCPFGLGIDEPDLSVVRRPDIRLLGNFERHPRYR